MDKPEPRTCGNCRHLWMGCCGVLLPMWADTYGSDDFRDGSEDATDCECWTLRTPNNPTTDHEQE